MLQVLREALQRRGLSASLQQTSRCAIASRPAPSVTKPGLTNRDARVRLLSSRCLLFKGTLTSGAGAAHNYSGGPTGAPRARPCPTSLSVSPHPSPMHVGRVASTLTGSW